jgi:hypothetical protein
LLPNADDRIKGIFLAPLDLHCHDLIGLLQVLATLAVPNYCPVDTEVLNLLRLDFSCLLSLWGSCHVLSANLDV